MVGPAKTLFMDEISTGLDSSTTYLIVRCIRNYVTLLEVSCWHACHGICRHRTRPVLRCACFPPVSAHAGTLLVQVVGGCVVLTLFAPCFLHPCV
jgi:hypothetical protein